MIAAFILSSGNTAERRLPRRQQPRVFSGSTDLCHVEAVTSVAFGRLYAEGCHGFQPTARELQYHASILHAIYARRLGGSNASLQIHVAGNISPRPEMSSTIQVVVETVSTGSCNVTQRFQSPSREQTIDSSISSRFLER